MTRWTVFFTVACLLASNAALAAPAVRTLGVNNTYNSSTAATNAGSTGSGPTMNRAASLRAPTRLPTGPSTNAGVARAGSGTGARLSVGQYLGGAGSMASGKSPIKSQNPASRPQQEIDLDNYVTINEFEILQDDLELNYYTKEETDILLDFKQDILTAGDGIDITDGIISVIWDDAELRSGEDGSDGREILLQMDGTELQWKYSGDETWRFLANMNEYRGDKGDTGETGADGQSVEMRLADGWIQWKRENDTAWNNLVSLAELSGGLDINGEPGNLIMYSQLGDDIADTTIPATSVLVKPKAEQLNPGDGKYVLVFEKNGNRVGNAEYMKVY